MLLSASASQSAKHLLIRKCQKCICVTLDKSNRTLPAEKKGRDYIERTISITICKGSVNHNSRVFNASNTDPKRSHLNIEYVNNDIKAVYHELFDDALKRYNDKQKRNDRKIADYYEKIRQGKQEKPFHEIIVQIGDCNNTNAKTYNGEIATKILDEYYKEFQKRNPNLRVFSAHLHLDEATPHLHIDFVPFTTGSKRGLDTRVSLKQALAKQGFIGNGREETEWNLWVQSEKEALSDIMWKYNIEWEQKGTHEKHLSVLDYKKQEREKEVDNLTCEVNALKSTVNSLSDLQDMVDIPKSLDTPEYQLPEPDRFMTAKAYKTKIAEPIIDRLKKVVKTVLAKYLDLVDKLYNERNRNSYLSSQILQLRREVDYYKDENKYLSKNANRYKLLCRAFGRKQIDSFLEQATQQRNRNYER